MLPRPEVLRDTYPGQGAPGGKITGGRSSRRLGRDWPFPKYRAFGAASRKSMEENSAASICRSEQASSP